MRISDWSSDVCSSDLAGEAQNFGMVARVDQSRRRIVAAIVERDRLAFAAAPMRDEKARDPLGKSALPHPLRPGQQPGMMDAAALPCFEERFLDRKSTRLNSSP